MSKSFVTQLTHGQEALMQTAGTVETGSKTSPGSAPRRVAAGGPRPGLALLLLASAQLMVVLDATIVNVALPHIQRALGFSGSGLEWVVNAYALTFGGLLLLGGRAGDRFGRRKMFIAGLLLFSAASLAGGFATAQAYGLVSAATSPNGVSHWGDTKVLAALAAAAVLLAAFAVIETRSRYALLPIRLLRDRTRTGAYLSYGGVGLFIFSMFFFLTVFMQAVWGYSALKTGVAYLPFTAALFIGAGAVAQLVPKIGARPILLAGSALSTGGLYWLSRISEHDTYTSAVLGPTIVIGADRKSTRLNSSHSSISY